MNTSKAVIEKAILIDEHQMANSRNTRNVLAPQNSIESVQNIVAKSYLEQRLMRNQFHPPLPKQLRAKAQEALMHDKKLSSSLETGNRKEHRELSAVREILKV